MNIICNRKSLFILSLQLILQLEIVLVSAQSPTLRPKATENFLNTEDDLEYDNYDHTDVYETEQETNPFQEEISEYNSDLILFCNRLAIFRRRRDTEGFQDEEFLNDNGCVCSPKIDYKYPTGSRIILFSSKEFNSHCLDRKLVEDKFDQNLDQWLSQCEDFCVCKNSEATSRIGVPLSVNDIVNKAKTQCIQKVQTLGEECLEEVQCKHLSDTAECKCTEQIFKPCTCISKDPMCEKIDEFNRIWKEYPGQTGLKVCPTENQRALCSWKCLDNLTFETPSPNYENCNSKWVTSFVQEIHEQKIIPLERAIEIANVVNGNLTAAINRPKGNEYKDSWLTKNIFGHELLILLNSIDIMAYKVRFTETDKNNSPKANFTLPQIMLEAFNKLFYFQQAWTQLNEDAKYQTFSTALDVIDTFSSVVTREICTDNNNQLKPNCISSFNFNKLETDSPIQIVQLGTTTSTAGNTITFPRHNQHVVGRDSFIKVTFSNDPKKFFIASLLDSKYSMNYSKPYTKSSTQLIPNGKLFGFNSRFHLNMDRDLPSGLVRLVWRKSEVKVEITLLNEMYAWGSEVMIYQRDLHQGELPSAVKGSATCVWWDRNKLGWSTKGCRVIQSSSFSTTCACDHLTSFQLLMKVHEYTGKSLFMKVVLILLLFLKAVYLLFKIYLLKMSKNVLNLRTEVTKNFGIALTFLSYGIFFFMVDRHFFYLNYEKCYLVGIVGHFLAIGINMVLSLEIFINFIEFNKIKRFQLLTKLAKEMEFQIFIGIPVAVSLATVIITVAVDLLDGPNSRGYGGEFCWLDGKFIWFLYIPLWTLVVLNTSLLVFTIIKFNKLKPNQIVETLSGSQLKGGEIINSVKIGIQTNVLVTVTWLAVFFQFGPHRDKINCDEIPCLLPFLFTLQAIVLKSMADKKANLGNIKNKLNRIFLDNKQYQNKNADENATRPMLSSQQTENSKSQNKTSPTKTVETQDERLKSQNVAIELKDEINSKPNFVVLNKLTQNKVIQRHKS